MKIINNKRFFRIDSPIKRNKIIKEIVVYEEEII